MNRWQPVLGYLHSLVVVNYLDLCRVSILPFKADPPLIVDPDTVLSRAVNFKLLKSIPGWNSQVVKRPNSVQIRKFPARDVLYVWRQLP